MKAPILATLCALLSLVSTTAAPADDLLPPPVRQAEKRLLRGNNNDGLRQNYYDGRTGLGAAFSPDGKFLISAAGYQGMALWDVNAGRVLSQLPNPNNGVGLAAAFTRDGKQLVVANWGNGGGGLCSVALWDVARRERVRSLDDDVNDTPFTAVAAAPDGKTLALAGGMGRRNEPLAVSLWDIASGDEVGRVEGLVPVDPTRRMPVSFAALAYSPDGRTLAVLLEGRLVLVETATYKMRGQFTFGAPPETRMMNQMMNQQGMTTGALAFSPDGRTLAAGCSDGAIRRFDLRAAQELSPLPAHAGPVLALCCPPDGKSILSYGVDGQYFVWRLDSSREWKPKAGPLADGALDTLWDALRGDDALDQYGCAEALAAASAQAVPYLRKHLAPAVKEDEERIDRLVQDMQKGDYNTRKKAVLELRKVGAAALPALMRSQQKGSYDELSQRLVFEFGNLPAPPEQVRALRSLAVLERIGDADARKLLEELGAGAPDAPLTIQAKAALARLGEPATAKPAPGPDTLWDALAGADGTAAYDAIRALTARPGAAAMLHDKLKESLSKNTFDDDPKRVAKLLSDLDSDDFPVRDQASKDLRNLGKLIVPALRKALEAKPSDEVRTRLEELLSASAKAAPPPEVLRIGRALEALERAGGPDGLQALEALDKDATTKWLREATAESLRRLREANR